MSLVKSICANVIVLGVLGLGLVVNGTMSQTQAEENTAAPWFTATPTILLRTPDPGKLAEFYIALGMKVNRVNSRGSVIFYHEGGAGSLEVVRMDANTQPGGPKESRTQQGVVAIFETSDLEGVVERAREANSPLIEKWTSSQADVSIYYIADWENNIFGYTKRNHNPNINTP